jgi:hypothetical protein
MPILNCINLLLALLERYRVTAVFPGRDGVPDPPFPPHPEKNGMQHAAATQAEEMAIW